MKTLIIGGTSGLGLELAKKWLDLGDTVWITGRQDTKLKSLNFTGLDLNLPKLIDAFDDLYKQTGKVDRLIIAAGFFQDGRVDDLKEQDIEAMLNVGARGPIYAMRQLFKAQKSLKELVVITSTSQWTPRQREPVYNFVKAGTGLFARSMAEDGRIAKVLLAGPAGMKTAFWNNVDRGDLNEMLDPTWVADQIVDNLKGGYKYKFIKIMRSPARVELVEEI